MKSSRPTLAEQLLEHTPLNAEDAARLILELLETSEESQQLEQLSKTETMVYCRSIIQYGAEQHKREQQTLPFLRTVQEHIRNKINKRDRTIIEIRQYANRIIQKYPYIRDYPIRKFTREQCHEIVVNCFNTPSTQRKAITLLHGIFKFGIDRGLCDYNPFRQIAIPKQPEVRIQALTIKQIRKLIETARQEEHLACAPALGFMLWAGIRPNEIERLTWGNINIRDRLIEVEPQHSKTGGARHVTMQPVLIKWLSKVCTYTPSNAPVTPKAWSKRWKSLRRAAGFRTWQADTLRHTFASYHLCHFKDLNALQLEMGHANTTLLRTRYLSMSGLTIKAAKQFWGIKRKTAEPNRQ